MAVEGIRLCAVATSSPGVDVMRELAELGSNQIEHCVVIGGKEADFKGSSLLRMTMAEGTRGHVMSGDRYSGAAAGLTRDAAFSKILLEAMDTLQRGAEGHAYRHHDLQHPSDYINYICIIADRLADILVDERINAVVFFDIPHLFYDSLLYRIAQHLGIRTLILRVGFNPAQFFSMERIEDLGHLRELDTPAPAVTVHCGAATELYYMKGISQKKGPGGRLSLRAIGHLATHIVTQQPTLLARPFELGRLIGRMRRVVRRLPDWRDPFAHFFNTDSLQYAETIADLETTPVDLTRRFVYFPLQLQPEMTTSVLGDIYRDQLLAIEQLAILLPPGVEIFVKENPKQNGQYRSPLFFHRLNRIQAVRMLPSHANTHELTAASQFVATISGTAAWEAVTSGKPALLFGDSWMSGMPGVFRFSKDLTFDQIVESTINHAEIEFAYGQLEAASHYGAVNRWAIRHFPQIDAAENCRQITRTLLGLLTGDIITTFSSPKTQAESEQQSRPLQV